MSVRPISAQPMSEVLGPSTSAWLTSWNIASPRGDGAGGPYVGLAFTAFPQSARWRAVPAKHNLEWMVTRRYMFFVALENAQAIAGGNGRLAEQGMEAWPALVEIDQQEERRCPHTGQQNMVDQADPTGSRIASGMTLPRAVFREVVTGSPDNPTSRPSLDRQCCQT